MKAQKEYPTNISNVLQGIILILLSYANSILIAVMLTATNTCSNATAATLATLVETNPK